MAAQMLPLFEPLKDLQLEHKAPLRARPARAARFRAAKEAQLEAFRAKVAARVDALSVAAKREAAAAAREEAEQTISMLSKAAISVYRNVPEMAPLFTRTPAFPARHTLSLPIVNGEPRDHVAGVMAAAVSSPLEEEIEKMNFAASRARMAMAALASQRPHEDDGDGAQSQGDHGTEPSEPERFDLGDLVPGDGPALVAPSFRHIGAHNGLDSPREIDSRPPTRRFPVRKPIPRRGSPVWAEAEADGAAPVESSQHGAAGHPPQDNDQASLTFDVDESVEAFDLSLVKPESYHEMKHRRAEAKAFAQRRKFMMDMEREKIRRIKHAQRESRRIDAIIKQKEQVRASREAAISISTQRAACEAEANRAAQDRAAQARAKRDRELERRAKRKETEMMRFVEALRAKIIEKVESKGLALPRLCMCDVPFWASHPDLCANNCVYYRDHEAYARAMADMLCSLDLLHP
ncbi:coiled-coil domain containing 15 [Thecamonas trahens ATCC 50062]|uniref:Coiled-coil domain containing 15 n=1 Tax=Thecamonas trahens ATCC 50062 TaxID=461836 RepID=A0A0L0DB41_THETB|nr:coiled-coil domain containing 15 [Thecamonas trahens ATCC 50062]KNC49460.1 coiled-coil domain containing 15 [Thecamonas trahens ATCC 50062]|eukprot:XP_013757879.1 coiled-coil domain containing 15 [Thecamonas trahens ATCC 50062]